MFNFGQKLTGDLLSSRLRSHMDTYGWCPSSPSGQESPLLERLCRDGQYPLRRRVAYIHIPFCSRICTFCGFNRYFGSAAQGAEYTTLVFKEMENLAGWAYINQGGFEGLYVGGGTPSLLPADSLTRLFQHARYILRLDDDSEITMETTVHDLDEEKLDGIVKAGVNRISMGIQTFDIDLRHQLGRVSDFDAICRQIAAARKAGVKTLSADILYRLPGQTLAAFMQDIRTADALGFDGVSLYPLIVMKGTPLEKQLQSGQIPPLADLDVELEQYETARRYLLERGFEQSTSTHFVRNNDRNIYNLTRLADGDCLPLGCGAGGFFGPLVVMNAMDDKMYRGMIKQHQSAVMAAILIDEDAQSLRTLSGQVQRGFADLNPICRHNPGLRKKIKDKLDSYVTLGLIQGDRDHYTLTPKGYGWCYNIAADLSTLISSNASSTHTIKSSIPHRMMKGSHK